MIYLDNAATTAQKPPEVIETMRTFLEQNLQGNPARGGHAVSLQALAAVEETRALTARFFGVGDARQVAFSFNVTAALNAVLKGLLKPGDHVITTCTEHNSVLRPLYQLEAAGVALDIVSLNDAGLIDPHELAAYLRPETTAIVVNAASNVTGDALDLRAVADICHAHDLLLIVDAAQAAGTIALDMSALGIDVLCFTGHKSLYGPGGTGGIVLGDDTDPARFRPTLSGGSGIQSFSRVHPHVMPTLFEAGTQNVLGLVGLSAGIRYLNGIGMARVQARLTHLTHFFREHIQSVPGVTVYGAFDRPEVTRAPIVALNLGAWPAAEISDLLAEDYDIATRPGAHCAPLMHEALGTTDQGIVRFSFSTLNTEAELATAAAAVRDLAMRL